MNGRHVTDAYATGPRDSHLEDEALQRVALGVLYRPCRCLWCRRYTARRAA